MGNFPIDTKKTTRKSRKGKMNGSAQADAQWRGFVNIPLDDAARDDVVALATQPDRLMDYLFSALDGGYKVSVVADEANECVVATLSTKAEANPNQGLALSGRGPDYWGALAAVFYKHFIVCDGGSWEVVAEVHRVGSQWG